MTPRTTWSLVHILPFLYCKLLKKMCLDSLSPKSLLLFSLEPEPVRLAPTMPQKLHLSRSPRKFMLLNIVIISHIIWSIRNAWHSWLLLPHWNSFFTWLSAHYIYLAVTLQSICSFFISWTSKGCNTLGLKLFTYSLLHLYSLLWLSHP